MKKLFILMALSAIMGLVGCSNSQCNGFSEEMQRMYFPYTHGQTLSFASNTGDTLSYTVSKVYLSKPYTLTDRKKKRCENRMTVDLSNTNGSAANNAPVLSFRMSRKEDAESDNTNWTPESSGYDIYAVRLIQGNEQYTYTLRLHADSAYLRYLSDHGIMRFDHMLHYQKDTVQLTTSLLRDLTSLVVVKNKGIVNFVTRDGRRYELVN
ncbi:MAG: hypothetical protein IJ785_00395 [Bacteroidales bacterium]|nr:hypothetical protein [Bacteroidales bacterium]